MNVTFSFIIPVFNRPQEIKELLESFLDMESTEVYEIVIIEDGSSQTSEQIIKDYTSRLHISYFQKPNTGPGDSRNYGMQKAVGSYFIILDSDVLMPADYLTTVTTFLKHTYVDCFGGADAAHDSFTPLQKAINYSMTSFFTTGGIRGNSKSIQPFEPRSFNMGISKKAFNATGGFAKIHPGEDPDLSQRIKKLGFSTAFIPNAAVFHKRRISLKRFKVQVHKFGMVRPILNKWHPSAAKITFWFPTLFVFFALISLLLGILVSLYWMAPLCLYLLLIAIDAGIKNRSIAIGGMAMLAVLIQFFGYGLGFLKATFYIHWLKKDPQAQFPKLFFK